MIEQVGARFGEKIYGSVGNAINNTDADDDSLSKVVEDAFKNTSSKDWRMLPVKPGSQRASPAGLSAIQPKSWGALLNLSRRMLPSAKRSAD